MYVIFLIMTLLQQWLGVPRDPNSFIGNNPIGIALSGGITLLGVLYALILGWRYFSRWFPVKRWTSSGWALLTPLLLFLIFYPLMLIHTRGLLPNFNHNSSGSYYGEMYITFFFGPAIMFGLFYLPLLGLLSVPFFLMELANNWFKARMGKVQDIWTVVVCLIYVFVMSLTIFIFKDEFFGSPKASEFFQLNAAIKNTCLLDPRQDHCPHSLTELSYIEPKGFARANKRYQLWYTYEPEKNEYIFMVRYSPTRAVVFSNKFVHAPEDYDFREYNVRERKEFFGKGYAELEESPPFILPWQHLPLWGQAAME